jgi:hypothetical protein
MKKPIPGRLVALLVTSLSVPVQAQEFQPPLIDWQARVNPQLTERIDQRMQQEMLARVESDYRNLYAEATEQDDFDLNGLHVAWDSTR